MKKILSLAMCLLLVVAFTNLNAQEKAVEKKTKSEKKQEPKGKKKNTMKVAVMKTSMGTIIIKKTRLFFIFTPNLLSHTR